MHQPSRPLFSLPLLLLATTQAWSNSTLEEVTVWGQSAPVSASDYMTPSQLLTPDELVSINAATTEDLVNYQPSLIVRRRFIGDSNGTLGMRGSNMFQTSRSMVFADGVPLHYFLQTRWSGAPRWSLVSADEIAQIKVLYGPYSAEYSGNAMGGVIAMETLIPTERRFYAQGTLFSQQFDELGFDKAQDGYKGFISYGDRWGGLSFYASYNLLENEGHPQSFQYASANTSGSGTAVSGAIADEDRYGNSVLYYGDNGTTDTTTDHLKLKLGYQWDDWSGLLNIAYENRSSETDTPNNYLRDSNGDPIWNGTVQQNGQSFSVRSRNFILSEDDRQSLLVGARIQGQLSPDWWLEGSISHFSILEDESRSSFANPQDPSYTPSGQVTDYEDTGWRTAQIKLQNDRFAGRDDLRLLLGMSQENYRLEINNYNSNDWKSGVKSLQTNSSGGETEIRALFAQLGWQVNERWDVALGLRYEDWQSDDGYYGAIAHEDRSEQEISPKFSVGFAASESWRVRYSLAKAYRFPIVEELFQNERSTNGTSLANANLKPEDGLHHNLALEYALANGALQLNLFHETIDQVIYAQSTIVDNRTINTFIPVDRVETQGIEVSWQQRGVWHKQLDIHFNLTYADAEITKNQANRLLEGKAFPRMPKWRANLLLTYHINDQWDIGGGVRYASNSYGDLDNSDKADEVFGAQDGYQFINLKTSYRINEHYRVSLGIDNLTDETAFVHHPWPRRTLFLEGAVRF